MMSLSISLEDQVTPKLSRFGNRENQSRCLDLVLKKIGQSYRAFVRKSYLSGGMLNKQSGGLYKSLRVAKKKGAKNWYWVGPVGATERIRKGSKGEWFINQLQYVTLAIILDHAGGYTITPRTDRKNDRIKKLVFPGPGGSAIFTREVQGKQRPFLAASFAAFNWPWAADRFIDIVYQDEILKTGLQ